MYSEINSVHLRAIINCSHKAEGILGFLGVLLQICLCCCRQETPSHRVQGNCASHFDHLLFFMQTGEKTICNYLKEERAE